MLMRQQVRRLDHFLFWGGLGIHTVRTFELIFEVPWYHIPQIPHILYTVKHEYTNHHQVNQQMTMVHWQNTALLSIQYSVVVLSSSTTSFCWSPLDEKFATLYESVVDWLFLLYVLYNT